jgi:uncharacterized protein GlcG (DUF336 family)
MSRMPKRSSFQRVSIIAVHVAAALSLRAQAVISQRTISLEGAKAVAEGALAHCRAEGTHATITVLDANGAVKVVLRDDGTSPQSGEVSRKKAYTALIYKRPSAQTAKNWAATPPVPNVDGIITLGGGVPIKIGDTVVGAIGVSGGPTQDKDEACANAGIAKIAEK